MSQENGGSAYPRFGLERIYRDERDRSGEMQYVPKDGMSLRDWFAGQYQPTPRDIEYADRHTDPGTVIAALKFAHADAMLKRREG